MENDPKLLECEMKLVTKFIVLRLCIFIEVLLLLTMYKKAEKKKNYGNLQNNFRGISFNH